MQRVCASKAAATAALGTSVSYLTKSTRFVSSSSSSASTDRQSSSQQQKIVYRRRESVDSDPHQETSASFSNSKSSSSPRKDDAGTSTAASSTSPTTMSREGKSMDIVERLFKPSGLYDLVVDNLRSKGYRSPTDDSSKGSKKKPAAPFSLSRVEHFMPLMSSHFTFEYQQLTYAGETLLQSYFVNALSEYCADYNLVLSPAAANEVLACAFNHFSLKMWAEDCGLGALLTSPTAPNLMELMSIADEGSSLKNKKNGNSTASSTTSVLDKFIGNLPALSTVLQAPPPSPWSKDLVGTSFQSSPFRSGGGSLGWRMTHFIGAVRSEFGEDAAMRFINDRFELRNTDGNGNMISGANTSGFLATVAKIVSRLLDRYPTAAVCDAILHAQGMGYDYEGRSALVPLPPPSTTTSTSNDPNGGMDGSGPNASSASPSSSKEPPVGGPPALLATPKALGEISIAERLERRLHRAIGSLAAGPPGVGMVDNWKRRMQQQLQREAKEAQEEAAQVQSALSILMGDGEEDMVSPPPSGGGDQPPVSSATPPIDNMKGEVPDGWMTTPERSPAWVNKLDYGAIFDEGRRENNHEQQQHGDGGGSTRLPQVVALFADEYSVSGSLVSHPHKIQVQQFSTTPLLPTSTTNHSGAATAPTGAAASLWHNTSQTTSTSGFNFPAYYSVKRFNFPIQDDTKVAVAAMDRRKGLVMREGGMKKKGDDPNSSSSMLVAGLGGTALPPGIHSVPEYIDTFNAPYEDAKALVGYRKGELQNLLGGVSNLSSSSGGGSGGNTELTSPPERKRRHQRWFEVALITFPVDCPSIAAPNNFVQSRLAVGDNSVKVVVARGVSTSYVEAREEAARRYLTSVVKDLERLAVRQVINNNQQ